MLGTDLNAPAIRGELRTRSGPSILTQAEVQGILASLRALVSSRWPQATVELYGSRATGLSLASSDVDVTLLGVPCGAGREAVGGALKVKRAAVLAAHQADLDGLYGGGDDA